MEHGLNSCHNLTYKSTVTNMATVRNFEVMSDIFNVDGICTEVKSSSHTVMMMMMMIVMKQ
jgi:hypothetical protein